jgi:hypothetical protein
MGKKKANKKKAASASADGAGLMVDPARVRFQHARIRPYFSGCGRSVLETLEEIRQQKISPSDLPPIQVIVGPETEDGPWYFSLNNRRLWVLKRCREEGLLPNNQIYVRVRKPKSEQEGARYSLQNCALEAKIMPEKQKPKPEQPDPKKDVSVETSISNKVNDLAVTAEEQPKKEDATSDEDSESSDEPAGPSNRFSALF